VRRGDERGIVLVVVLVVLASIALLMSGVYSLISEGGRSARSHVQLGAVRSVAGNGLDQVEAVVESVAIPGQPVGLPGRYAGQVQWAAPDDFADYVRGEASRPGAQDPCSEGNPDIQFDMAGSGETVTVAACAERMGAGSIPGTGAGAEFARSSGNVADQESLLRVRVWARGQRSGTVAQLEAVVRALY
jgi:hypothetical protein